MRPPFLISVALLFWGWQTGLLLLAVPLAVILESHRIVRGKWDMTPSGWNHVFDLCIILMLGILIYGFLYDKNQLIYNVGRFFPLTFFPFIVTQSYSSAGKVDLSTFSLIAGRRKRMRHNPWPPIDFTYPYLVAALLAAGMGNTPARSYYAGVLILGLWGLLPFRSRAFPLPLWLALAMVVATAGHYGHIGLRRLQEKLFELASHMPYPDFDPMRSTTSIGDIGRMKLSDRILFRVRPDKGTGPFLLKETSYNAFRSPNWFAVKADLQKTFARRDAEKWKIDLTQGGEPAGMLQIEQKLKKGSSNLKLPEGVFCVENLPAAALMTNALGSIVLIQDHTELGCYRAHFSPRAATYTRPTVRDLEVPDLEARAIMRVVDELHLAGKPPEQVLADVKAYFSREFGYSLALKGRGDCETALEYFLLERRAGHCEYFATATALILRACDIPARYTTGYLAVEYSPLERQLVVRKRHAHAWVQVYFGGHWRDFDTTPSNWIDIEEKARSPWQLFSDLGAFISFKFSQFRWSEKHYMEKTAVGLMLLLALSTANRLRRRKGRGRRTRVASGRRPKRRRKELLSGIRKLEWLLSDRGYPRNPGEPLMHWAERMQRANPRLLDYADLQELIHLHYSLRFSAGTGMEGSERQRLDELLNGLKGTLAKKT